MPRIWKSEYVNGVAYFSNRRDANAHRVESEGDGIEPVDAVAECERLAARVAHLEQELEDLAARLLGRLGNCQANRSIARRILGVVDDE